MHASDSIQPCLRQIRHRHYRHRREAAATRYSRNRPSEGSGIPRQCAVGARVAIIGAGGIGYDMAEFLLGGKSGVPPSMDEFATEYRLDTEMHAPGGIIGPPVAMAPRRQVTLLQPVFGKSLGASTGWILSDRMRRFGVQMIGGASYERIDDQGLHIQGGGERRLLDVDHVIVCAGQESVCGLYADLTALSPKLPVHLIGGAHVAEELDAMRAIDEATRL